MLTLPAKIRKDFGKKVKKMRQKNILPAVLYGPKIKKTQALELDYKEFEKIFQSADESSLILLEIRQESPDGEITATSGTNKKIPVLIHEFQRDSLTGRISHIDFYQVSLEEKATVKIPVVLEGTSPAVKELSGTLVKHISEIEVRALPQNLPKEIKVNVENLKTFEDNIRISDLGIVQEVEILRQSDDLVASVLPPEKVDEELEKPIEEKVEEVEKVEKEKKEEELEAKEPAKEQLIVKNE